MTLKERIENLVGEYMEIKREIRQINPRFYERWKAGGYLIDEDIISMYPNINDILDTLPEECPECGEPMKDVVNDVDGTNLENGRECSDPDCSSHEENEEEATA